MKQTEEVINVLGTCRQSTNDITAKVTLKSDRKDWAPKDWTGSSINDTSTAITGYYESRPSKKCRYQEKTLKYFKHCQGN